MSGKTNPRSLGLWYKGCVIRFRVPSDSRLESHSFGNSLHLASSLLSFGRTIGAAEARSRKISSPLLVLAPGSAHFEDIIYYLLNNRCGACVCSSCEMERRGFWQNYLISTAQAAGCWMLGSGVIVKQQCLPGNVAPHHCQLLSAKIKGGVASVGPTCSLNG